MGQTAQDYAHVIKNCRTVHMHRGAPQISIAEAFSSFPALDFAAFSNNLSLPFVRVMSLCSLW